MARQKHHLIKSISTSTWWTRKLLFSSEHACEVNQWEIENINDPVFYLVLLQPRHISREKHKTCSPSTKMHNKLPHTTVVSLSIDQPMHHHLVVLFTQYTGLRPEDADVSAVHILKWPRVLPIALQKLIRTHARKALGQSSSQTPKPDSVLTPPFTVLPDFIILATPS